MLLNKKGVAKVSKTPGKTKLINYFLVNDNLYFVDLPGYGYAKLSKKNKIEISKINQTYFKNMQHVLLEASLKIGELVHKDLPRWSHMS